MIRSLALPLAALALAGSVALAHPHHHQPVKGSVGPPPQPQGPPRTGDYVWPERIRNAKVLPADIGSERLRRAMTGYARALGVRCTHCHVGEEGAPLASLDFVSDANPHKEMARGMIRLTQQLNERDLPAIPGLERAQVTCFTCHRGAATPAAGPDQQRPPDAHIAPDTPARPH